MKKALALLLVCIISMSTVGCTKDKDNGLNSESSSISSDTANNSSGQSTSSDTNSKPEESKDKEEIEEKQSSDKPILSNEWEYSIENDNIVLKRYIGEETKLTVKNSYTIEGKEYYTVIDKSTSLVGPFLGNDNLSYIKFEDNITYPKDKSYMFKDCKNLTYTNSENILITDTTSTTEMFSGCMRLNVLDISSLKLSDLSDTDKMLNDCLSLSLVLVKDNASRKDIITSSNIGKNCIVAEKMDKSIWEYTYDRATGILNLTKYKGKGTADASPAYSVDGALYTNVSYGTKNVDDTTSSSKPSNGTSSKPSNNTKPNKPSSGASSKPSNGQSSSSSSKEETIYYTVKFNTGDGTNVQSQKVLKGKEAKKPSDPSNDTYKFYGWYTGKSYNTKYYFDEPVNSDITLYARWEDASCVYGVEHYKQNGDRETYTLADSETIYTIPNTTVTAQPKSYSGYTENKYHPDREYRAKITEDDYDIVLRLYYDKDTFTARFNSNGGNSINSQTVSKKSKFKEIIPRKTNSTFEGWYTDSKFNELYDFDSEVRDISLYAKWKSKTADYRLEHYKEDINGNYRLAETEKFNGSTDSTVSATAKSYEGYTENTSHPERIATLQIDSSGNSVLKLYYALNNYRITFETDGGSQVTDQNIKYGDKVKSVTTTKEGFTFDGWYTDTSFGSKYDFNSKVINEFTLYAKWNAIGNE